MKGAANVVCNSVRRPVVAAVRLWLMMCLVWVQHQKGGTTDDASFVVVVAHIKGTIWLLSPTDYVRASAKSNTGNTVCMDENVDVASH